MIELEDIAYVRSGVADLPAAVRFATFGVRRIEDDAAWRPRTFDPAEPGSIDMWLGPTSRPRTQPQAHDDLPGSAAAGAPSGDPARVPAAPPASLPG